MKALIAIIVVVFALISAALAITPGSSYIQNYNNNFSKQIHVNQSDVTPLNEGPLSFLSDSLIGTTNVSFNIVVQEAITTALLVIGSIAVLKKNKN